MTGHDATAGGPLEEWVGRTSTASAALTTSTADLMALTLGRDPGFADGDPLPPGWHWLYFPDRVPTSDLARDGHPEPGTLMPPVDLPRRMWAAGSLHFSSPLHLGATVERTSTIAGIRRREGRSGPLCFVTVEHEITTGAGRALAETQEIVYRGVASSGAGEVDGPPAPNGCDFSQEWGFGPSGLFRYSALTFNAHRIHLDAEYCRTVEGYPGLVVHGPLIATLLMDAMTRHLGPIGAVHYRARSPLFLPDPFVVSGRAEGAAGHVWAATPGGRLAMEANVTLRTENT